MCGIIGLLLENEDENVNQMLFDGLTVLQHRGQDAAGMVTADRFRRLHLRKDNGLVKDVFQAHHMMELQGNVGLGHCRYPTAGTSSCAEAQPLYTNYPYGICVAHNGNIVNTEELTLHLQQKVGRHVNTDSDSELLLNLFAEHLNETRREEDLHEDAIFKAVTHVMQACKGGYAGLYLLNGIGLVGFRDPHGIRPLVVGARVCENHRASVNGHTIQQLVDDQQPLDYIMASESVAIDTLGFELLRDIEPGEAIFIDIQGRWHARHCHSLQLAPCIFEYVYFARPDSIMDGISVYEARLKMGEKLAQKILRERPDHDIDVVIPIPDTSRTSALQLAYKIGRPFQEGFIKNRYIARTFIMPGQATRKKSVRLKLNTIKSEFVGKNVLLVDDSIVRGTTAREIVQMARDAGARKVYFCSAAPPIRYPNIYGIDIPTRHELVAFERNETQIAQAIGCDWVMYQDLKDLEASISELAPPGKDLTLFDTSCFSGTYVTGERIEDSYFSKLHNLRNDEAKKSQNNMRSCVSVGNCESVSNDTRGSLSDDDACESITNQPVGMIQ